MCQILHPKEPYSYLWIDNRVTESSEPCVDVMNLTCPCTAYRQITLPSWSLFCLRNCIDSTICLYPCLCDSSTQLLKICQLHVYDANIAGCFGSYCSTMKSLSCLRCVELVPCSDWSDDFSWQSLTWCVILLELPIRKWLCSDLTKGWTWSATTCSGWVWVLNDPQFGTEECKHTYQKKKNIPNTITPPPWITDTKLSGLMFSCCS